MPLVKICILLITIILLFWTFCFLYLNDFSTPTLSIEKYKRILVILPHPDDEVLMAGGLMALNKNATLLILTKGERGTKDGKPSKGMRKLRTEEAKKAAKLLDVQKLIHLDYGDGQLEKKAKEMKNKIAGIMHEEKPDLVVTYDLSGLYGHPDHIVTSRIVTDLVQHEFITTELWYGTYSKRAYDLMSLPNNLAKDKEYLKYRTYPSHKVFIGSNILKKIQAVRAYQSQSESFQNGIPLPIPSAFFHSITMWEYFYKVKF